MAGNSDRKFSLIAFLIVGGIWFISTSWNSYSAHPFLSGIAAGLTIAVILVIAMFIVYWREHGPR